MGESFRAAAGEDEGSAGGNTRLGFESRAERERENETGDDFAHHGN